jgi:hypothetical protein
MIHISPNDICLVIDPLIVRGESRWGTSVMRLVGTMAQEIQHVGLGFDADGDLFVRVNLPSSHLNIERFQCILMSLCQVADNLILPILQANAFDKLNNS